ncbi:hypothetical protein Leryth_017834 [Lithospermum erythrorhizon]|nr:hypothetical protein Leryth_017834 [Lithospermum erythrorhizon]
MVNPNSFDPCTPLHVVMFPFFAFGHISPFVQLSKKLSSNGVKISFFSAQGNVDRIKKMLDPSTTTNIVSLTLPHVDGLSPGHESTSELNPASSELLKVALDLMQPQIRTLLIELKPHFVIFDFAQHWIPRLASELGIKTVYFSVFIAMATAFITVPSRINPETNNPPTLQEMKNPPPNFPKTFVTSLKTFEALDFLYVFKSFNGVPGVFERVVTGLKGCSAILAKTCKEMEGEYIKYVESQFDKPVLLVGPVVPEPTSSVQLEDKWANWFNQFTTSSVIFCSFGSETFLSDDQIKELVLGLELTGLPFFLVLNFPANLDVSDELNRVLPEGFLGRIGERGLIHSGWVQQQQILAHKNVGCYVCHGGFSSVMEALVNDCQLVMLPQKGDQFVNAKLVCQDLKAGVEVNRRDEDGYFNKEDISEAVGIVMLEGANDCSKSIKENHRKWKDFLMDKNTHNKFIQDLVKDLKAMV